MSEKLAKVWWGYDVKQKRTGYDQLSNIDKKRLITEMRRTSGDRLEAGSNTEHSIDDNTFNIEESIDRAMRNLTENPNNFGDSFDDWHALLFISPDNWDNITNNTTFKNLIEAKNERNTRVFKGLYEGSELT